MVGSIDATTCGQRGPEHLTRHFRVRELYCTDGKLAWLGGVERFGSSGVVLGKRVLSCLGKERGGCDGVGVGRGNAAWPKRIEQECRESNMMPSSSCVQ